ncbi:MAG: DUF5309 domain-containing protein [Deltaproteobacteria bacterium]|nr:DUF5309 domain-containing protein [Deltaproteobacteria bacterium]
MATVSGMLKDASVNGKPRDLMDLIFNVAPTDTPFLTMCGKSSATQTLHEWQTDTLAAPAANAQLEGHDVSSYAESNTTELSNRTQILEKAISVSGTAQAVKQAGVSKQYSYQMALRMKELKKDVEFALLSNVIGNAESGSTPRKMRGLPCWFTSANSDLGASTGANANPAASPATACVAGTTRVPTQALVMGVLTSVYTNGGNPDCIMMAPEIRVKMSSVLNASGVTRMEYTDKKKATAVIDVFVSDFGTLKLIPNRVQAAVTYSKDAAFMLDPDYWKVAYLRGFREEQLARTGDSIKGHIIVEATLEARNPLSSGMLADLKKA